MRAMGCHVDDVVVTGGTGAVISHNVMFFAANTKSTLRWRHNERDSVSSHQPHDCLLNGLFRRRSKKTSKLRVTGLCVGNSPGPVNSPHKGPVMRKMFPFDDVIMNNHVLIMLCVCWEALGQLCHTDVTKPLRTVKVTQTAPASVDRIPKTLKLTCLLLTGQIAIINVRLPCRRWQQG